MHRMNSFIEVLNFVVVCDYNMVSSVYPDKAVSAAESCSKLVLSSVNFEMRPVLHVQIALSKSKFQQTNKIFNSMNVFIR